MYKLRELSREDIPTINKWRNDNSLIKYLGAPFRFINLDVDLKWYDNYLLNRSNTVRCVIVDISKVECILGLVSLTNIDSLNRSAEFHIMIGNNENRGKGLGYFATLEMINHGFNNLNLHRIELSVLESNFRAINLYEKAGFKKEGIKREVIFKNGKFENLVIMSNLREE